MQKNNDGKNVPVILVVEDNDFMRKILVEALKGYKYICAKNRKETLKLYIDQKPDIVFLDIMLPDGNGIDLIPEMIKENPKAFVVVVSGEDLKTYLSQAISFGAKGYITKPYSKAQIEKYLQKFMQNNCSSEIF